MYLSTLYQSLYLCLRDISFSLKFKGAKGFSLKYFYGLSTQSFYFTENKSKNLHGIFLYELFLNGLITFSFCTRLKFIEAVLKQIVYLI
jgi:hypothetical protein